VCSVLFLLRVVVFYLRALAGSQTVFIADDSRTLALLSYVLSVHAGAPRAELYRQLYEQALELHPEAVGAPAFAVYSGGVARDQRTLRALLAAVYAVSCAALLGGDADTYCRSGPEVARNDTMYAFDHRISGPAPASPVPTAAPVRAFLLLLVFVFVPRLCTS
jgi:hypothetical protein